MFSLHHRPDLLPASSTAARALRKSAAFQSTPIDLQPMRPHATFPAYLTAGRDGPRSLHEMGSARHYRPEYLAFDDKLFIDPAG